MSDRLTDKQLIDLRDSIYRAPGGKGPGTYADVLLLITELQERRLHDSRLRSVLKLAHDHVQELRDAWSRGAISEHDGKGGERSNRNFYVDIALRDMLKEMAS